MSLGRFNLGEHLDNRCQNSQMHPPGDWALGLLRMSLGKRPATHTVTSAQNMRTTALFASKAGTKPGKSLHLDNGKLQNALLVLIWKGQQVTLSREENSAEGVQRASVEMWGTHTTHRFSTVTPRNDHQPGFWGGHFRVLVLGKERPGDTAQWHQHLPGTCRT